MSRTLRVYADTSVIGGCFDTEFEVDSNHFISQVRAGKIHLLTSEIVVLELKSAPENVVEVFQALPRPHVEIIEITDEVINLRNAYLAANILPIKSRDDLTHVAAATVARADAIVSWNFKHIVKLEKMKAYNQVNLLQNYGILTIITPKGFSNNEPDEN